MSGIIDVFSSDQSAALVDAMIRSSEFNKVLQSVEDRARYAVVDETKKNAVTLMTFAVAGGAIGGMVFKGYFGTLIATGLAAWAGWRMLAPPETTPATPARPTR